MSTTTTTNRPYLTAFVGKTVKGTPYAYALEGYIGSAAPFFSPAKDDKNAFLSVSMGLRGSAARLLARANGTYSKDASYGKKDENGNEVDEFASVRIYGEKAEKLSGVLTKGIRIVVSGPIEIRPYKTKAGNDAQELVVTADNITVLGSKKNGIAPTISDTVGSASHVYTTRDGVVHNENLATGVIGTVVGCKGLAVSEKGTKYLSFGIRGGLPAEKVCDLANGMDTKGKEYDPKRAIVNAVVFGDAAERLSKVVRNGAIVTTCGPVEARDYSGNISYQIRARDVIVAQYAPVEAGAPAESAAAGTAAADTTAAPEDTSGYYVPDGDDDGELPF